MADGGVVIPVGRLTVATPETMALAIRAESVATDAVDERIESVAVEIIGGAPTVVAAAAAAAGPAVAAEVADVGLVTAIPKNATASSSRTALPIAWQARVVNDPWSDAYTDTETATWTDQGAFGKDVPLLDNAGRLYQDQMPTNVALKSDIPVIPPFPAAQVVRVVRPEFPIFGARVAAGFLDGAPVAAVFAGSSTTAARPGYLDRLGVALQSAYPVSGQSVPAWSTTAEFSANTAAGIHIYSAGENSTTSANYLTDTESARIAALQPGLIVHMIGSSNDYTNQANPATVQSNIAARLTYFDTVLTKPCQHVLIHTYARMAYTPATYPHSAYGAAIKAAADARDDTEFVDISGAYRANGVPGGVDPLDLIGTDNIHQTAAGYRFMADLLASIFVS